MKRMTIVCLLSGLLFAGAVAGAAQISFWHPWGPGTTHAIAVEQIAEAFEKMHSEIDVEVVACGGAGDEINKFLVAVASGTPPDLAIMGGLNVEWIESGILQRLTAYFDRDGLGPENSIQAFMKRCSMTVSCGRCPSSYLCAHGNWSLISRSSRKQG